MDKVPNTDLTFGYDSGLTCLLRSSIRASNTNKPRTHVDHKYSFKILASKGALADPQSIDRFELRKFTFFVFNKGTAFYFIKSSFFNHLQHVKDNYI